MKVILYTTHCPKCTVLQKKLQQKKVNFREIDDVDILKAKGFMSAPMLQIDDDILDFASANKWINEMQ